MLPDAMSILARSTRAPLGNSPARMRRNRSRFSSTRAVAERAVLAGLGQRAAGDAHLLLRLVVDIGLAGADQVLGPFVELLEIVRGVIEVLAPVEAEPAHVALDGVDVFLLFLGRIGVVEAQVAAPAELLGDAEIEADRLGVADVQIAVRLRRKAGHHARRGAWRRGRPATMSRMKSRPASAAAVSAVRHASPSLLAPMCQIRAREPSPQCDGAFVLHGSALLTLPMPIARPT